MARLAALLPVMLLFFYVAGLVPPGPAWASPVTDRQLYICNRPVEPTLVLVQAGKLYVPLEVLTKNLKAQVTVKQESLEIEVNGTELGLRALMVKNVPYVPVEPVAQAAGCKYQENPQTGIVDVIAPPKPVSARPTRSVTASVSEIVTEQVSIPGGGQGRLVPGIMVRPARGVHPAVLHLHGTGDHAADNVEILERFAHAGYVALDLEFDQGQEGLADVESAVQFLANSAYVSGGKVGINGFSLGARLGLLEAERSNRVRAVSSISGRTSSGSNPTVLDGVANLRCPVLIQHGSADSVVPYDDSVRLEKRLRELGRNVKLITYEGADHQPPDWDAALATVVDFFNRYLK